MLAGTAKTLVFLFEQKSITLEKARVVKLLQFSSDTATLFVFFFQFKLLSPV